MEFKIEKIYDVIGHPNTRLVGNGFGSDFEHVLLIGDVLGRLLDNMHINYKGLYRNKLLYFLLEQWDMPRYSIEEQSERCIDFIFTLIQQGTN